MPRLKEINSEAVDHNLDNQRPSDVPGYEPPFNWSRNFSFAELLENLSDSYHPAMIYNFGWNTKDSDDHE